VCRESSRINEEEVFGRDRLSIARRILEAVLENLIEAHTECNTG